MIYIMITIYVMDYDIDLSKYFFLLYLQNTDSMIWVNFSKEQIWGNWRRFSFSKHFVGRFLLYMRNYLCEQESKMNILGSELDD